LPKGKVLHREDAEDTRERQGKVNGENRRLNVMVCEVWEFVGKENGAQHPSTRQSPETKGKGEKFTMKGMKEMKD